MKPDWKLPSRCFQFLSILVIQCRTCESKIWIRVVICKSIQNLRRFFAFDLKFTIQLDCIFFIATTFKLNCILSTVWRLGRSVEVDIEGSSHLGNPYAINWSQWLDVNHFDLLDYDSHLCYACYCRPFWNLKWCQWNLLRGIEWFFYQASNHENMWWRLTTKEKTYESRCHISYHTVLLLIKISNFDFYLWFWGS